MQPIDARELSAEVQLERLGGRIDSFSFQPSDGFLASTKEVAEPHSFDVTVTAQHAGQKHTWSYQSYEGRVVIPADVAARSGITTAKASSHLIRTYRHCRGKIVPSEHRIAHVIPRFAGVVREGRKHIGDRVEKGEVLAIIESNQSLQPFEVRSQISGTVVNGHLVVGEYVPENQWVYIVADLSEVWADFLVPLRERGDIAAGQKVVISPVAGGEGSEGQISYVAPYADERSQAQLVRAVVPNQRGTLLPGTFIKGEIVVQETAAPVAVRRTALQRFRGWDVVFVKVGDTYQATPVEVGRSDGDWSEVVRGLSASDEYVTANSFLVKADILKSGASHDH
jgi:cobalt-zinc-cadmium efflux system membrane fusion protein